MPLSYFRRSAFLWLVSWLGLLALLRAWGFFDGVPPGDPALLAPRQRAVVEGRVAEHPRERRGRLEFAVSARSVDGAQAEGLILVRAPERASLAWGDRVRLTGRLFVPAPPETPGTGGWRGTLGSRGIHSVLEAAGNGAVEVLRPAAWPLRALASVRTRMLASFRAGLEAGAAAVLGGLVLGEKSGLDGELLKAFRDAGAVHLLVASGSNVAFVLLMAAGLARWAGLTRAKALAAGLAAGLVYTLAAGADAPLLRGFLMTAAGLAGFYADRNSGAFQGLVLACWAMSLVEPRAVFQPGFQMSFAACFGLVAAAHAWRPPAGGPKPLRYAAGVFLASLAAQIAIWPALAVHFHQVSAVALLSNVVLVPLSGVLMAGGFLLFGAALTGIAPLVAAAGALVGAGLALFESLVGLFARLPGLQAVVPAPSPAWLAAYLLAAFALWSLPDRRRALGFLAAGAFSAAASAALGGLAPSRLRLWFCSDSALVTTVFARVPGGGLVIVNAGLPGGRLAESALALGHARVEAVLLGCRGRPCWAGLEELAGRVRVREVAVPAGPLEPDLAALRRRLEGAGTAWRAVWPGESLSIGGALFTAGGSYTGRTRHDRVPWRVGWREFAAWVDLEPGSSVVKDGCAIMKRATGADAPPEASGLPERTLARRPPLLIETDGWRVRALETAD